jgi:cysteine synthase A
VKPFSDPNNYNHLAKNFAKSHENHFWTNQFDNRANMQSHFETTGPEILKDCIRLKKTIKKPAVFLKEGTPEFYKSSFAPKPYDTTGSFSLPLSAFVCATGSGGTLSGVAKFLKENSPQTRIVLADPPGAVLFNAVKSNLQNITPLGTGSITEGIGQGRITSNLKNEFHLIDDAVHILDSETINMVFKMLDEEGLLIGASTALNVVSAVKVAKMLGPGHRVVTILCDTGHKYQSRLFSRKWLESKKLYNELEERYKKYVILK